MPAHRHRGRHQEQRQQAPLGVDEAHADAGRGRGLAEDARHHPGWKVVQGLGADEDVHPRPAQVAQVGRVLLHEAHVDPRRRGPLAAQVQVLVLQIAGRDLGPRAQALLQRDGEAGVARGQIMDAHRLPAPRYPSDQARQRVRPAAVAVDLVVGPVHARDDAHPLRSGEGGVIEQDFRQSEHAMKAACALRDLRGAEGGGGGRAGRGVGADVGVFGDRDQVFGDEHGAFAQDPAPAPALAEPQPVHLKPRVQA